MNKGFKSVFALIIFSILMVSVWFSATKLLREAGTEEWISIEGYIQEREVVSEGSGSNTLYKAHLRYDYKISTERAINRYTGTNIYASEYTGSRSSDYARELLNRFPYGSPVKVYYNPEDPSEAVLIPGIRRSTVVSLALASFAGVVTLVLSWFLIFGRRKKADGKE